MCVFVCVTLECALLEGKAGSFSAEFSPALKSMGFPINWTRRGKSSQFLIHRWVSTLEVVDTCETNADYWCNTCASIESFSRVSSAVFAAFYLL